MKINLISDTVTKPTKGMLNAMFEAEVGDDVFRADPTINALEQKMAKMFDKEAALFCPSGTMTNQIAIKMHTQALDEVMCDHYSHVFQYETGAYAFNSGVAIQTIPGSNGKITADQVKKYIKSDYDWLPQSKLLVLENSCNKGGGSYYTLEEIRTIYDFCQEENLILHLDGARLFNVLVETKESTQEVGKYFDSISICLSKGLGAPVGSVLIGSEEKLKYARRVRKALGGGMRQAGYLAAACIYALDHHIDRLKEDNQLANDIADFLKELDYISDIRPCHTNILIFDIKDCSAQEFLDYLEGQGVLATAFGPNTIRFVTHFDVPDNALSRIKEVLENFRK